MTALTQLQQAPQKFTLFAALRAVDQGSGAPHRLGETGRPSDDSIRVMQPAYLHCAESDLLDFEVTARGISRLHQYGFGLLGPNGPLPIHMTELCFERLRQFNDPGPLEFLNLVQHRVATLFYRAWANSDPATSRDRPDADQFALDFSAFVGLAEPEARARNGLDELTVPGRASHLVAQARSGDGLQTLLADYFALPIKIRPFIGQWLDIPDEAVTRIGGLAEFATLGSGATLGNQSWQTQCRFEIVIGPLKMNQFTRFLPGSDAICELAALVRAYTNDEWAWQVRLLVTRSAEHSSKLSESDVCLGSHGQLGWTSWLGRRPEVAPDVVLDGETVLNWNHGQGESRWQTSVA